MGDFRVFEQSALVKPNIGVQYGIDCHWKKNILVYYQCNDQ